MSTGKEPRPLWFSWRPGTLRSLHRRKQQLLVSPRGRESDGMTMLSPRIRRSARAAVLYNRGVVIPSRMVSKHWLAGP
jgi:hypothetical protein